MTIVQKTPYNTVSDQPETDQIESSKPDGGFLAKIKGSNSDNSPKVNIFAQDNMRDIAKKNLLYYIFVGGTVGAMVGGGLTLSPIGGFVGMLGGAAIVAAVCLWDAHHQANNPTNDIDDNPNNTYNVPLPDQAEPEEFDQPEPFPFELE